MLFVYVEVNVRQFSLYVLGCVNLLWKYFVL